MVIPLSLASIKKLLTAFFEKNLFERLVVYIFFSHFAVKFVFELILREWSFVQSQHQQWIFYGLLALDYIISVRKVINIRVTVNPMSIMAFIFLIMTLQGLIVGIYRHNTPFIILNDTVPILMIALNIFRMQSKTEIQKPIDLMFLFKFCMTLGFFASLISMAAILRGAESDTAVIDGPVYFPLLFTGLIALKNIPIIYLLMSGVSLLLAIPEMNRTTMGFIAMIVGSISLMKLIQRPAHGIMIILITIIALGTFWTLLPEDSKTYTRIMNMTHIDLERRTGSIGERSAEWDAIQRTLRNNGKTIEYLGLGFGGTYTVQFTHQLNTDYGHAHYSWAWFNLRYGKSGYLYLILFVSALLWNASKSLYRREPMDLFVSYLCLMGLLYCVTHVNSVLLQSGLHFFYNGRTKQLLAEKEEREEKQEQRAL